jgi:regulator of nucleoside diphosphate kinase
MSNIAIADNTNLPPIRMTAWDFWKLDSLLRARAATQSWRSDAILRRELQRSAVVWGSPIPPDLAIMRSRVEFRIAGGTAAQVATLVYPGESHLYADAMSVLAPFGAAILGLSEGQSIAHAAPDGSAIQLTLLRVLRQPETDSGDAARLDATASSAFEPL